MPEIGKALDVSNWSGEIPLAKAKDARAQGYDLAIVGTQKPKITQQQLDVFEEAGFRRQAYTYFRFDRDSVEQTEAGLAALGGRVIELSWLDWEDDTAEALTEQATVEFMHRAHNYCIGKVDTGCYTRPNWWIRQTGDTKDFAGSKLWLATADNVGDLSFNIPFGGFPGPWMEQIAFDADVAGIHCDLNVYDRTPVAPPKPPEPPKPSDPLLKIRLEALSTEVRWTDEADIREVAMKVRIVRDE